MLKTKRVLSVLITSSTLMTGFSLFLLLQSLFKSEYGFTPKKYLQKLRINTIRDMLIESNPLNTNVYDIALEYNYFHMGHFSSEYKKMFKESPSETLSQ